MKKAFTLAEVLITLGIIGIIAALTIPGLIANYQKKVVETRLAKFYSTISQAVKLSEVDNGEVVTWEPIYNAIDLDIQQWCDKYLCPYVKTLKTETGELEGKPAIMLYLADGSAFILRGNSCFFFPDAKNTSWDIAVIKQLVGAKAFTFGFFPTDTTMPYHYGKGVEPYAATLWDGTEETLRTHPKVGCNQTATNEKAFCTKLIQVNGWKIPDDYPVTF